MSNGLELPEYARDMFSLNVATLPSDDTGKVNFLELMEFSLRFGRGTDADLISAYPELLNEHVDTGRAIALYRRFSTEASSVLGRYPNLASLIA